MAGAAAAAHQAAAQTASAATELLLYCNMMISLALSNLAVHLQARRPAQSRALLRRRAGKGMRPNFPPLPVIYCGDVDYIHERFAAKNPALRGRTMRP
jgi:hypothetical protein